MTDPKNDPARCIPILASLNIDETHDFYVGKLGFTSTVYKEHNYLIVRRDEMEIHFWLSDDRRFPENTSCYIRGGQIVALYDEYRARKIPKLSEFTVRPWNMKEFYVIDPHGNLLRFGCIPEEAA
ncbi:MAG: VOC family protein [Rhizobiales bacterium]|nr:VOC family protein [Hyphomicrobiales bacterium]